MMISLFDWIWIEVIAVTSIGTVAYCLVLGKHDVQQELEELRAALEHQRNRKKFWKAKAKGHTPQVTRDTKSTPFNWPRGPSTWAHLLLDTNLKRHQVREAFICASCDHFIS